MFLLSKCRQVSNRMLATALEPLPCGWGTALCDIQRLSRAPKKKVRLGCSATLEGGVLCHRAKKGHRYTKTRPNAVPGSRCQCTGQGGKGTGHKADWLVGRGSSRLRRVMGRHNGPAVDTTAQRVQTQGASKKCAGLAQLNGHNQRSYGFYRTPKGRAH